MVGDFNTRSNTAQAAAEGGKDAMMALLLALLAAEGAAAEGALSFSEWLGKGGLSARRGLQEVGVPPCMSDCVFDEGDEPTSCADIQGLFEGTFDSQLGVGGCGLDCTSAADVSALQTMFRALKVQHLCIDVETGLAVGSEEATCGNSCTGQYTDDTGNSASCDDAFDAAANTMVSSCPHGCTFKRNEWRKATDSFGRNGDTDPGCMLPFSFLTHEGTETASCPIGYDVDSQDPSNCVWDGEFCAVHTITGNGDGTFTHDYSLPAGKACQSCWNGYTSDGQYVCPCSLSCVV